MSYPHQANYPKPLLKDARRRTQNVYGEAFVYYERAAKPDAGDILEEEALKSELKNPPSTPVSLQPGV